MKVVVLVSGGMDSVTALHWAMREHEVLAGLSFLYGAKHHDKEIPMAAWQCAKLGIPHQVADIRFIAEQFQSDLLQSGGEIPDGHYAEENMKRTVVPFRNGIMLAMACGFAESREAEGVVIAAHAGDHAIYPDCRESFMAAMAVAMEEGTYARIALLRPFVMMDKTGIARLGGQIGVDFSRTWSCYKGADKHCGTCGTCVERREAFLLAGIQDVTDYASLAALPSAPTRTTIP